MAIQANDVAVSKSLNSDYKSSKKPDMKTPLPYSMLVVVLACLAAEAFTLTLLFPFVAFMVRDFKLTDDDSQLGYYAGIIASSFTICQFLSSSFWGYLSDRVGRRPVLLIGLIGNTVCTLLFGLSKSFWQAILFRSINGLLNGNLGVVKSYIREITDETNQSQAFSYMGLVWGLSSVVGPVAGGFFADPVHLYPSIFKAGTFLARYPYFLPCACSAAISLLGLLLGLFALKESLPPAKRRSLWGSSGSNNASPTFREICRAMTQRSVLLVLLTYCMVAWAAVVADETFSIWALVSRDTYGLGFETNQIAICLSVAGLTLVIFQLFLWPHLDRMFGIVSLFRCSVLGLGLTVAVPPFFHSAVLHLPWGMLWFFLIVLYVVRGASIVVSFTCSTIMQQNVAPPNMAGSVNGGIASAAALSRAIGPIAGGTILAWSSGCPGDVGFPFDYHFVFLLTGLVCFVCLGISLFMGHSIARRTENLASIEEDSECRPLTLVEHE